MNTVEGFDEKKAEAELIALHAQWEKLKKKCKDLKERSKEHAGEEDPVLSLLCSKLDDVPAAIAAPIDIQQAQFNEKMTLDQIIYIRAKEGLVGKIQRKKRTITTLKKAISSSLSPQSSRQSPHYQQKKFEPVSPLSSSPLSSSPLGSSPLSSSPLSASPLSSSPSSRRTREERRINMEKSIMAIRRS